MGDAAPNLIFLGLLLGIFYFTIIRPQKRRVDQHRSLIESVGLGDEVVTIGGAIGTVRRLGDEEFELEVGPGVNVRYLKSAIARRVSEDLDESDAEDDESPVEETGDDG